MPAAAPTLPEAPARPAAASLPAAATLSPGQAFTQVLNLRSVALVFYLCLGMAFSRSLGWLPDSPTLMDWVSNSARFTRQSLFTGMAILLMVALAEALLTRSLPPRQALALRVAAVFSGALLGALVRHTVIFWGDAQPLHIGWMISNVLLWSGVGGGAYALWLLGRADHGLQAALLDAQAQRRRLQAQQLEAQLAALNAQIEPHFLFNTLANVKRLYETAPDRGRDMLSHLIAYLRAALPNLRRSQSTLGEELTLVHNYLAILQMRMGERLHFHIQAEPGLQDVPLPPLVLPTLVENAIKHGLGPLPEGGQIAVRACREGATLVLEVADDGHGFGSTSGGAGVGLANTRARLDAMYGSAAALELHANQPRGVVARVRLPLDIGARPAPAPSALPGHAKSPPPLQEAG